MTFGLAQSKSISNLFRNWLKGNPKKDVVRISVGVCFVIWTMWNTRNDFIFNKPEAPSFLQVIPMITHWIRTWSYIQQEKRRVEVDYGCNHLEMVARD
jgi:hypothetical protein